MMEKRTARLLLLLLAYRISACDACRACVRVSGESERVCVCARWRRVCFARNMCTRARSNQKRANNNKFAYCSGIWNGIYLQSECLCVTFLTFLQIVFNKSFHRWRHTHSHSHSHTHSDANSLCFLFAKNNKTLILGLRSPGFIHTSRATHTRWHESSAFCSVGTHIQPFFFCLRVGEIHSWFSFIQPTGLRLLYLHLTFRIQKCVYFSLDRPLQRHSTAARKTKIPSVFCFSFRSQSFFFRFVSFEVQPRQQLVCIIAGGCNYLIQRRCLWKTKLMHNAH